MKPFRPWTASRSCFLARIAMPTRMLAHRASTVTLARIMRRVALAAAASARRARSARAKPPSPSTVPSARTAWSAPARRPLVRLGRLAMRRACVAPTSASPVPRARGARRAPDRRPRLTPRVPRARAENSTPQAPAGDGRVVRIDEASRLVLLGRVGPSLVPLDRLCGGASDGRAARHGRLDAVAVVVVWEVRVEDGAEVELRSARDGEAVVGRGTEPRW